MKKILISAFTPFYKSPNNYSAEVLNYISSNVFEITKEVIDVVYDKCFYDINEKYDLDGFDLIIALGEARGRSFLTYEVQAQNLSSCSIADNSGALKIDEAISENSPKLLKTSIDLKKLVPEGSISYDAGKFVCNNLYYHLLSYNKDKCLFIHIPECNNNIENYKKYADEIISFIEKLLDNGETK